MARKCQCTRIDPNQSTCCRAAAAGHLGQSFQIQTKNGVRCARCEVITKRTGAPGFRFRFVHDPAQCPSATCQALAGQGRMQALPTQGFLLQ
jgi:hypothetical protein